MKGFQLWSKVQHTLFCREISYVASYARNEGGGGSQKGTNDDEGVTIPPKNDDVIYEQPPKKRFLTAFPYRREKPGKKVFLAAICAVIAASATME